MPSPLAATVAVLEVLMLLAGLALLWRFAWSPAARANPARPVLPHWDLRAEEFVLFVLFVFGGWVVLALLAGSVCRLIGLKGNGANLIVGGASQLGWLLGCIGHRLRFERGAGADVPRGRAFLASGAATFLIAWPLVTLSGLAWRFFLQAAGVVLERQPMIDLFSRANSPGVIALMILLAVVIAPVTEELVFRGGLFRYVRGRTSRTFAIMGPALIFGAFHTNLASLVPLVVLAIVLSQAYERTGHIGTPIVAHALFNLNTVLLIYSGVGDLS